MSMIETFDDPFQILVDEMGRLGLENTSGVRRYYALYLGEVTDNDPPGKQGMVEVIVRVTGSDKPIPLFARPCAIMAGPDYGFYVPPEKGDMGWVAFDHGDPTARPRYLGSIWKCPLEKDPSTSEVPAEFKNAGPPKIRGFKTPRGSGFIFDDRPGSTAFEVWTGLQTAKGIAATKHHRLRLDDTPGQERIELLTTLGRVFRLVDNPASEAGAELSVPGHSIVLKEQDAAIELTTTGTWRQTALGGTELTTLNGLYNYQGTLDLQVVQQATMTFLAGLIMTVVGLIVIGGPLATGMTLLTGVGFVTLGSLVSGVFLRLVNETFVGLYNANVAIHNANVATFGAHVHPFIGNLGVPGVTSPTLTPMSPVAPVDPNTVTTQSTVAN